LSALKSHFCRGDAVNLLINAQVMNGFITPVLLTYILILANRWSVPGNAANGPIFRAVDILCVTVAGLLSAVVLVQTVAGWL
jgi:Mn2+/Fe2+ NRAMP family transporter